ncbi:nucleotide disphospho-sugar-binding domain-containing protein [Paenibacillus tarimensis]|uniref:nucleotide disphospho-sugar-binding domain-containing protein n=1 Tax=Paenibacillus tarimensis TaxID=416012 RepID=UPI001F34D009|nr:nucleotide disphospho-sugar-binding domain-containing protein [Paenibacillus tarimensis]MCF2945543.1 hypothetical protein [Paenibacillus tarimensis]
MKKLLFFMLPAHGHINPTLSVANELVRRGIEIIYYTTEEFSSRVRGAGAEVRVIGEDFGFRSLSENGEGLNPEQVTPEAFFRNLNIHVEESYRLLDQVKAEEADGAVCDPMCMWGRTIIERLHMPRAMFFSGIVVTSDLPVFNNLSAMFDGEVSKIIRDMFTLKEELILAPIPREFQPDAADLKDKCEFIGPTIIDRTNDMDFPIDQIKDQPTIYISLGSILQDPGFYDMCIEAFADSDWKVVMVAKTMPANRPSNFLIYPFVPQLEVLKHADLFISHGGMNSVMESLWHGVPLITVPLTSDQPMVAARVEELNLGMKLDIRSLSAGQIKEAAFAVNSDLTVKERVKAMQAALHQAGGSRRGADLLEEYFAKEKSTIH